MAGTITGAAGAITCDILNGTASRLRRHTVQYEVVGHNGYGYMDVGLRGGEFMFRAVRFGGTTSPDVKAWITSLEKLEGTRVTIVDDVGDTWADAHVQSVERQPIQAARTLTGSFPENDGYKGVVILRGFLTENPT